MMKPLSVREVLRQKRTVIPFEGIWRQAFDRPEDKGTWFIWGNSGNGKTSFAMQLSKELSRWYKVLYFSLEEGVGLTMQETLKREDMINCKNINFFEGKEFNDIVPILRRRGSPRVVVIDSFQYTRLTFREYLDFKKLCKNKLIIFTSQARGKQPSTDAAKDVMYDAALKIRVEGFRAISCGRFIGNLGYYTIWEEEAARYWGVTTTQ